MPGAVIELRGEPGEAASAQLELETDEGRRLSYRQETTIGAQGRATLRVPYATEASERGVRALGPYWLKVGSRGGALPVPEEAVLQGTRLTGL